MLIQHCSSWALLIIQTDLMVTQKVERSQEGF